jgi:hypothetical protein
VVVLAGSASFAIAMDVGWFAFTPILLMMLHDGMLDFPSAVSAAVGARSPKVIRSCSMGRRRSM